VGERRFGGAGENAALMYFCIICHVNYIIVIFGVGYFEKREEI
jgi:hypothetical protein